MENAFEIIPAAGLMQELDFEPDELNNLQLFNSFLNPNLILDVATEVEPYGMVDFQVEIIEVIPPDCSRNESFFQLSFSDIYAEKGERVLSALEVERNFELKGKRWIMIGGILDQVDELVPPAIIIVYYEDYDEALYTIVIKEELQDKLFTHRIFHPLN